MNLPETERNVRQPSAPPYENRRNARVDLIAEFSADIGFSLRREAPLCGSVERARSRVPRRTAAGKQQERRSIGALLLNASLSRALRGEDVKLDRPSKPKSFFTRIVLSAGPARSVAGLTWSPRLGSLARTCVRSDDREVAMIRAWLSAIGVVLVSFAAAAAPAGIDAECGGIGGLRCAAGLWCEPPTGACGRSDLIGVCVDIHRQCHHNYHAVCGCNGVTYGNECARQHESVPQAHIGRC